MKTKCILLLLIVCKFSAFAQQRDTMIYHPTYSATETFSMRVGRLLEREAIEYQPIDKFVIQLIKLKDAKSGEQQFGVILSQKDSDFKGVIDIDELDNFIANIEILYTRMRKVRPDEKLTFWSVTKGGVKCELTTEFPKSKEAFAKNPWTFMFSCYPFKWEHIVFIELKQLQKIINTLKQAQNEVKN